MQMQVSHQSTPEDIKRYLTHLAEGGRSIPPRPACCPCLELLAEHACGSEQRTAGWAAQPNVTSAPEGAYESTLGGTKNMRKRILASLMALILALSLLPTAALATGETQEPEQEAQIPVSEDGTEGGGEDATIPVETGDETDTSDGTETPVITTPTVTPTETTPVETLTPEPTNVTDGEAEINGTQHATLADAITAVTTGQTIVLRGPIDGCEKVTINKPGVTFTIDFAGYTLTSASADWAFQIEAGNVTLMGGTVQGAYGGISCSAGAHVTLQNMTVSKTQTTGKKGDLSAIENSGTMVIESGTYNTVAGTFAPTILNLAEMTIEGGTFETGATDSGWSVMICRGGANTSTNTVITGGSFVNEVGYGITCSNGANVEFGGTAYVRAQSPALGGNNTLAQENFTVTGGTLISEESAAIFFPAEGKLEISDGTITGLTGIHALMGDIEISGGTITGTATKSDIEEGYPGSGSGPRSNGSALLLVSNWYKESATDDLGLRVNITDGTFISANDAKAIDHMMPDPPRTDAEFTCTVRGGTFYNAAPDEAYIPVGYQLDGTGPWTVTESADGALVVKPEAPDDDGSVTGTLDGVYQGASTNVSVDKDETGGTAPDGEGTVIAAGNLVVNLETPEGQPDAASTTLTVEKGAAQSLAKNNAQSLTLQTDVGSVKLGSDALSKLETVTAPVEITVEKVQGSIDTWEVTVAAGGDHLLSQGTISREDITITVPYTLQSDDGTNGENIKVFCVETGEDMNAAYNGGFLSWTTSHLSTFTKTVADADADAYYTTNDGVKYGSLATAIQEVNGGGTITLQKEVTVNDNAISVDKDVKIDLHGYTITGNDTRVFHVKSGTLTLTGTGTVTSKKATNGSLADTSSVIRVGDNDGSPDRKAALVVESNVTIKAPDTYGISVFGNATEETVTIRGAVEATGPAAAVSGNGSYDGTTISLEGAKISATCGVAIYHPQGGTMTITKSTVNGGIEAKSGTIKIENSTISAVEGMDPSHPGSGNGPSTSGYAIAIVDNAGYGSGAKLTVESGTVNGDVVYLKDGSGVAGGNSDGTITINGGTVFLRVKVRRKITSIFSAAASPTPLRRSWKVCWVTTRSWSRSMPTAAPVTRRPACST